MSSSSSAFCSDQERYGGRLEVEGGEFERPAAGHLGGPGGERLVGARRVDDSHGVVPQIGGGIGVVLTWTFFNWIGASTYRHYLVHHILRCHYLLYCYLLCYYLRNWLGS